MGVNAARLVVLGQRACESLEPACSSIRWPPSSGPGPLSAGGGFIGELLAHQAARGTALASLPSVEARRTREAALLWRSCPRLADSGIRPPRPFARDAGDMPWSSRASVGRFRYHPAARGSQSSAEANHFLHSIKNGSRLERAATPKLFLGWVAVRACRPISPIARAAGTDNSLRLSGNSLTRSASEGKVPSRVATSPRLRFGLVYRVIAT